MKTLRALAIAGACILCSWFLVDMSQRAVCMLAIAATPIAHLLDDRYDVKAMKAVSICFPLLVLVTLSNYELTARDIYTFDMIHNPDGSTRFSQEYVEERAEKRAALRAADNDAWMEDMQRKLDKLQQK